MVRRVGERGQPRHEPVGLHHSVVSNLQFSGEKYPTFDRLRTELSSWRSYYLDPRVAMREAEPPREVNDIGSLGNWIAPFLFRLKTDKPQHFAAIRRAVGSAIPSITGLDVKLDERHATLDLEVIQDGVPFSSRVASEGTLRVIALCAIAMNPWPASLVAFEEPENGVHPNRIEVIADLLHGMPRRGVGQVVVTTHSPTLVASMLRKAREGAKETSLMAVRRSGVSTEIRDFPTVEPLFTDSEVASALTSHEDSLVAAMLSRGGLDACCCRLL